MCILAANLVFALRRNPTLDINIQPVEAGWCVTMTGSGSCVSATHADPAEAFRLAAIEVAPE